MQDDIAARKASGGAVAPVKGGASRLIDTGIRRVDVGGVTKLRVRYGPAAARTQVHCQRGSTPQHPVLISSSPSARASSIQPRSMLT